MLLIRLERRAHTKDEPERKKRGERERPEKENNTKTNWTNRPNEASRKEKKLCRSREFAMAAECNKQTALVAFLLLPFPSLSLSPSPSSLSSIYFLMPVQPINKMPLELAITSAIAVRLKEEATYWLTEGQMLFNICTLANKSKWRGGEKRERDIERGKTSSA